MKIIVVQRFSGVLEDVRGELQRLCRADANEIIYLCDPLAVVPLIGENEPVIVVSGQIFEGMVSGGTMLARIVKERNPNSLFYIYSNMPETNEFVDGVIPKVYGSVSTGKHPVLVRILGTNLDGATSASIREQFPEIT